MSQIVYWAIQATIITVNGSRIPSTNRSSVVQIIDTVTDADRSEFDAISVWPSYADANSLIDDILGDATQFRGTLHQVLDCSRHV